MDTPITSGNTQTNPGHNADTVGQMVGVLLVQGAGAVAALVSAAKAFGAGDIEEAERIVTNQAHASTPSGGGSYFDLNMLMYECLYRGDDAAPSGF
jgi:hypothetical protein